MKILFVSEQVVRLGEKTLPSSLDTFINRYVKYGDLTCMCYCIGNGNLSACETTDKCNFLFMKKENSLKNKIFNRIYNVATINNIIRDYDVVIVHLPSAIGGHAASAAHKNGICVIGGVVGCAFEALWYYNWKGKLMAIPCYLKMKRTLSYCNHAFYVSAQFLQRRYPCKGKTIGCSNVAIDAPCLEILFNRLNKIEATNIKNLKLATVGNVNLKYKGQKIVLKAIASLKNKGYTISYGLIGGGSPEDLQKLAAKLGISEVVKFHGRLPHENVMSLLSECDVYVQPSLTEGVPRSVIEAMSLGIPVIGSGIPGIQELIPMCRTFKKGDYKKLTERLLHLTKHDLTIMAKENFEKSKEYSKDVLMAKRNNFFNEILKTI